jgi:hypothetical protein
MKTLGSAAMGAALFGSALLLPVATDAQNAGVSGIPGVLNPSTGMFTARPALLPATSALQRKGQINVVVNAVFGSNIPAAATLSCTVYLSADDLGYENSASSSGVVVRKGSSGTCRVAIPYTFEIAIATTPMNVTASITTYTSTVPELSYSASFSFSPFAVPNGTKNLSVTLAM